MAEVDLNIENYDLDDILKLFNLSYDFNEYDLKQVYKVVLKTHPDKSNLDKSYFLFYTKAFKMLKKVYDYKNRKEQCVERSVYDPRNNVDENEISELEIKKALKSENFNKWFNKTFDKIKLKDEEQDDGYSNWLKSDDGIYKGSTKGTLNEIIERKKQECRALVVHRDLEEYVSTQHSYNLTRDRPMEYSSDMFSKLQYEDLRKAHTETVVPVTQEDYHSRQHFKNVDDLQRHRKLGEQMLSMEQSKALLEKRQAQEEKDNMYRSYKMMKQMDDIKKSNNMFFASLKQLTN